MVVGTSPQNIRAIERTLHEIEWLAEGFLHQFFDRFGPPCLRRTDVGTASGRCRSRGSSASG